MDNVNLVEQIQPAVEANPNPEQIIQRNHQAIVNIKTPDILGRLRNQYSAKPRPPIETNSAKTTDWFKRLSLHTRIEIDHGNDFTIDVQNDTRFATSYIIYNVAKLYPTIDIKEYPYVSPFTLVGYATSLMYAQMLLNDLYVRNMPSIASRPFKGDPQYIDFLSELMEFSVPPFMRILINKISSILDPNRPGLQYCPCLASSLFKYDFGRLFPAGLWLITHDALASRRANLEPLEILRYVYRQNLINYDNVNYTVTNLLGAQYIQGQNILNHPNWINQIFESFFNPVVNRNLLQRPTLARTQYVAPVMDNADYNPYFYALACDDGNYATTLRTLRALSQFFSDTVPNCPTVAQVAQETTGITMWFHTIESITLPTWHKLEAIPAGQPEPTVQSDATYAQAIHFLVARARGNQHFDIPQAFPLMNLLQAAQHDHLAAENIYRYVLFGRRVNVHPDVLLFQPYDRQLEAASISVTYGLKIETAELDGVTIPLPNINQSLIDNNSNYRNGSILARYIRPYIPTVGNNNYAYFIERHVHEFPDEEPIAFAFRDMAVNMIPVFDNAHVHQAAPAIIGARRVERNDDQRYSYTYAAWRYNEEATVANDSFWIWSSYRHTPPNTIASRTHTSFYYTLRSIFGLNVPLSRLRNPIRLLPN